MSVLTKLRALHEEVCHAWRRQTDPVISEGEAEVLNLGFLLLEALARESELHEHLSVNCRSDIIELIARYLYRVHAQFDDDADIVLHGEHHNE